jgi:uncharacterized protein
MMMTKIKLAAIIVSLVTAVSMLAEPTRAASFAEGQAAYRRGDHATAARKLLPLASAGNSQAQALLGFMYEYGHGVPQDAIIAAQLYQCAADQGHPAAQYQLGLMFDKGHGVPRSAVLAYKFLNLATAGARPSERDYYMKIRNAVATKLNLAQLKEAQQLAVSWVPTPAPCSVRFSAHQ